jgi:hypothetical protein
VVRETTPQTYYIPEGIADVPETITRETLICAECRKNYRIIAPELKFYKTQQLPIPRMCSNCRHLRRLGKRNPRRLFERTCKKCSTVLWSTYSAERPEMVYCEKCYQDSVF